MTPAELTAEREKLGLTQAQLARALGITPLAIWRYESGMYKVPKLMQMAWFRRVYAWVMSARQWARDITAPVMMRLRRLTMMFRTRSSPRYLRMAWRFRRRMQSTR